jgi:ketosteroid isomerase-like protein
MSAAGSFAARWTRIVAERDLDALGAILHDDVVLRSPVLHRPTEGRLAVGLVLAHVVEVLEPLRYTGVYEDGANGVVLRFTAHVAADDGRRLDVEGVDVFALDDDGRIRELTVMLRPLSALQAVGARMRDRLLDASGPGRAGPPA